MIDVLNDRYDFLISEASDRVLLINYMMILELCRKYNREDMVLCRYICELEYRNIPSQGLTYYIPSRKK